jgi:signal transduction histidine kinase
MASVHSAIAWGGTALGVALAGLCVVTYRRWSAPVRRSLAAFVGVLAVAAIGIGPVADATDVGTTTLWLTTCVQVAALAWTVFALRYTGRGALFSTRLGRAGAAAYLGVLGLPFALGVAAVNSDVVGFLAISGYMLGLVVTLLGAALVIETTVRHGYLSGWVGVALAFVAIDPWFLTLVGFATQEQFPAAVLYGLYVGGFLAYVVVMAGVVLLSGAPAVTVATQTVGRRALLSETADFVVVVDDDGRIVERNAAVRTELSADVRDGDELAALLGVGIEELADTDSLELQTTDGLAQYDVATVELTGDRDEHLGWLVSLRDITDRRRREQGLEVLNRILRHNLRNEMDVVKARGNYVVEQLDDPTLSDHLSTALSSVDSVLELADKARGSQRALDTDGRATGSVDIADRLEEIAADVAERFPGDVTIDGERPVVTLDRELFDLAVRNAVENALEHNTAESPRATVTVSTTTDGVRVRVDDNGPGIPDTETEAIGEGRETPSEHATSIGLWLIEWATTAAGGTATFGESPEGGRVDLWFPDRG